MAKLFDKDNMDFTIILSIVVIFICIVVLAVFLSNFKFEQAIEGTVAVVLNEGDLAINYIDGNEIEINDTKEHSYGISINNQSNNKIFYSIYFTDSNFKNATIKIKDYDGNVINEITENITGKKLINLYSIEPGQTVRYTIDIQAKNRAKFRGTLKVSNDSLSTETFADLILYNNELSSPVTRIGVDASTTDEGLISTIDNKGTTYYFRGNIDYNYVKIGELLFRIVRINGDNSVRLVLDSVLENQIPYNTNKLEDDSPVSTLATLQKASITTYLNNWLDSNLANMKAYISNGDFCTDTNFKNVQNNISYSSAFERIYNDKTPDLYCNGNIYSGPIGLLSADEVLMAGGVVGVSNSQYYLYNKSIPGNYVTSSSYFINSSNNIAMINVMSNGSLGDGVLITNQTYIRPVINISENAKVKGSGTIEDPYIIVS